MAKAIWKALFWCLLAALVVGYAVITLLRHTPEPTPPFGGPPPAPTTALPVPAGNPLLTADKEALARWYPSTCFAELYMKSPSFGGRLVPGCIHDVEVRVKAETGYVLTDDDLYSFDTIAHFKRLYGANAPWRH